MRVATYEMDIRAGEVEGNLANALAGVKGAARHGAALVALPEMWPTSFVANAGDGDVDATRAAVDELARVADSLGVAVVGSGLASVEGAALPANRAHVLMGGKCAASYDKVHLFSPTAEHIAFCAGSAPPPVTALPGTDVRIAPIICYDLRFPAVARAAFRAGAEILVVVAQWPDVRASHWKALVRGRAAEAEAFVVACNRVGTDEIGRRRMRLTFAGDAQVVGPNGEPVPVVTRERIDARGAETSRLSVSEIDIEEVRALRRAVPVARDERRDVARGWLAE